MLGGSMQFYGQSKPPEDQIADAVFGDYIGVAVEVGAFDGVHLSNCYHFYLKGWRCINFEPHPENYAALCINQPEAINFQFAVGGEEAPVPKPAIMQTTPGKPIVTGFDLPEWYIKSEVPGGRSGLQALSVQVVSLNKMLYEHHVEAVDYISIDTDGTELDVLHGFSLALYRPRLLIVEYNHNFMRIDEYICAAKSGYQLAHTNSINGFWTRTQADYDAVQRAVK